MVLTTVIKLRGLKAVKLSLTARITHILVFFNYSTLRKVKSSVMGKGSHDRKVCKFPNR